MLPLIVGIAVFGISKAILGGWLLPVGMAIPAGGLAMWALVRSNTVGLARANVAAYAMGRELGLSHRDALRRTVETRYAMLPAKNKQRHIEAVWKMYEEDEADGTEVEDLRCLVTAVLMHEHPGVFDSKSLTRVYTAFRESIEEHGLGH